MENGVSKILYIDLAVLREMGIFSGHYDTLSFGADIQATPFNDVKVDHFDAVEIERKLNQVFYPVEAAPKAPQSQHQMLSTSATVIHQTPGTTRINSEKPVRISLSVQPKPVSAVFPGEGLIPPSEHSPFPEDNSLETLAALKIARRKSLNI